MWPFTPGERFPYSNFHAMNQDWIIIQVKKYGHDLEEYKQQLDQMGIDIEQFREYIDGIDDEIQQKIETEVPIYVQQEIQHGLLTQLVAATRTRRVVIIGDSYGAGWTPDGDVTGFPIVIKNSLHLSNDNFFNLNKGGARFGASQGNEYAFDTVLNQLLPNIDNKDSITDIIFAGGYNESASSYDSINEGIARCKSIIESNFHNPSLRTYLFAIGYHCSNPNQRFLLYNRYKLCYSNSGFSYVHLTPSICYSEWWASDGYHPLQTAQNIIAKNIINILNGGVDISSALAREYATTNQNDLTFYVCMNKNSLHGQIYGSEIRFNPAITLNRTTPVKIMSINSKLPLCNVSDASIIPKQQIKVITEIENIRYENHTLTIYMQQNERDNYEIYALLQEANAAGNNYIELQNVTALQIVSNEVCFDTEYEF